MCLERVHRFMMSFVLALGAGLLYQGIAEGIYVIYFVIAMLFIYGLTNFCPFVWMLGKAGVKKCS